MVTGPVRPLRVLGREHLPGETFVKICGITRLGDALVAADAGASAVGFVFAPSPRRVGFAQAAEISGQLPEGLATVGVFVDAGVEEVLAAVTAVGLAGVQLQGREPPEAVEGLRAAAPDLFVIRALRVTGAGMPPDTTSGACDALMVDSKDAHRPADGQGPVPLAWLDGIAHDRLIVAGGLRAETVGEVIAARRPWGVDVSSGVEEGPGRKDPNLIRAFVRAVRAAEFVAAPSAPTSVP
jgi:phosphoribosylanthranilate isomerase